MSRLVALLSAVSFLAYAPSGSAFVRERSVESGKVVRWKRGEIVMSVVSAGPPRGVSSADLALSVEQAMHGWSAVSTGLRFRLGAPMPLSPGVARDGVNAIVIRTRAWCRDEETARERCYDPEMLVVTSLYFAKDGAANAEEEIVEADLEINAVDWRWRVNGADPLPASGNLRDLRSVLVHELGHVLGLAHTCDDGASPRALTDDRGQPRPRCGSAGALDQTRSVMGAEYLSSALVGGLLPVRDEPLEDDRRAVKALYPPSGRCDGCAHAGPSHLAGALASCAVFALSRVRRRNRRPQQ